MAVMLTGRLLAESLRVGADLEVADLRLVRIGRHDVSNSTTPPGGSDPADDSPRGAAAGQPPIWTFLAKLLTIEPTIWHRHWPRLWRPRLVGGPTLSSEAIMWWSSLDVSSVTASATHALGPRRSPGGGRQELRSISLIGVTEAAVDAQEMGADRGLTMVSWPGSVSQGDRRPPPHVQRSPTRRPIPALDGARRAREGVLRARTAAAKRDPRPGCARPSPHPV
jgi:hypothetical protein